ncbi:MAG: site-specific DNA-methyltransferase [Candidatus Omnitrophica bacterium]|nr:site-specific DNA-methyltransferase [Candidatus Omnitrophota bacterium]
MPSINFKGKNAVWNHHLSVPYQTLEKDKKLSVKGKNEDENLIIEADNLIALKSLLPKYQGQIKCIYIDPPYNTGNENWVYNDKISSPLIKDWINKIVGADDLTRHDKWLCMMTPRLKGLQELLSNEGIILISIDQNEISNLKSLMDEIFSDNFLGLISVVNNWKGRSDDEYVATCNEYLLVYAKDKSCFEMGGFPLSSEKLEEYDQEDQYGKYKEVGFRKTGKGWRRIDRPDMFYPVYYNEKMKTISLQRMTNSIEILPLTKDKLEGRWRWGKDTFLKQYQKDIIIRPVRGGEYRIFTKMRLKHENGESRTLLPKSTWIDPKYDTAKGAQTLKEIFQTKEDLFDNPKPIDFIKDIIMVATEKDSIILDSFAGSGTTAHSVLALNKEDGGNRKFILVQLPERIEENNPAHKAGFKYVHEITRERVKRVIDKDKLDVGFSYMKLGPQIDADSMLSGKLPSYKEFAKYVYYLATGKTMNNEKLINEKDFFVGKINGESVYLIYEKDKDKLKGLAITLDWAQKICKKDKGKKIIYAPACFLDEEYLEKFNIHFVGIPYSLFEKK